MPALFYWVGGVTTERTMNGTLRYVDAGVLSVGYVEAGPLDGSPVLLLHGWPYDVHSFVEVIPVLADCLATVDVR